MTGRERGGFGRWMSAGAEAWEGRLHLMLLLAVAILAGWVSLGKVAAVATLHGQGGLAALVDAWILETAILTAGLDMRRRRRHGKPIWFPVAGLVAAVAASQYAQVAMAERSVTGWVFAVIPALGFLFMVKLALARLAVATPEPAIVATGGPATWSARLVGGQVATGHPVSPVTPAGRLASSLPLAGQVATSAAASRTATGGQLASVVGGQAATRPAWPPVTLASAGQAVTTGPPVAPATSSTRPPVATGQVVRSVADVLATDPDVSDVQLARLTGLPRTTARRARAKIQPRKINGHVTVLAAASEGN